MGKRYLIDHVLEQYRQEQERKSFDLYNSEILRAVANNVAQSLGGTSFPKSYTEAVEQAKKGPETRTPEQIKAHVLNTLHNLGGGD